MAKAGSLPHVDPCMGGKLAAVLLQPTPTEIAAAVLLQPTPTEIVAVLLQPTPTEIVAVLLQPTPTEIAAVLLQPLGVLPPHLGVHRKIPGDAPIWHFNSGCCLCGPVWSLV